MKGVNAELAEVGPLRVEPRGGPLAQFRTYAAGATAAGPAIAIALT